MNNRIDGFRLLGYRLIDAREPAVTSREEQLRAAATRLTAGLDEARLFQAAAWVAMAVDEIDRSLPEPANDDPPASDVELEFDLDEHGRVWMYRNGDAYIIGRKAAVAGEMWRFLRRLLAEAG